MAKNQYIIIRTTLDTPTPANKPVVVFAGIEADEVGKGDFITNHTHTNKKAAIQYAETLNDLFSASDRVYYKVYKISEVEEVA